MEQYAFVRSMYPSVPFDVSAQTRNEKSEYARNYKEFRKAVKDYLLPSVKDGRGLDGLILAKAQGQDPGQSGQWRGRSGSGVGLGTQVLRRLEDEPVACRRREVAS